MVMESDMSLMYLYLLFMKDIFLPLLLKFLESVIRVLFLLEDSCLGGGGVEEQKTRILRNAVHGHLITV